MSALLGITRRDQDLGHVRAVRRWLAAAIVGCVFLCGAPLARAVGGHYVFAGGTAPERAEVTAALDASRFDWSLVRETITIHIQRDIPTSFSLRGVIWLDANLLDAGEFSWGTVEMEYGQQVHFYLLGDRQRAHLTAALGAKAWCYEKAGVTLDDNGCERFAATLAWSYWPSTANSMRPSSARDPSGAMAPAAFRALLSSLFGTPKSLGASSRVSSLRP